MAFGSHLSPSTMWVPGSNPGPQLHCQVSLPWPLSQAHQFYFTLRYNSQFCGLRAAKASPHFRASTLSPKKPHLHFPRAPSLRQSLTDILSPQTCLFCHHVICYDYFQLLARHLGGFYFLVTINNWYGHLFFAWMSFYFSGTCSRQENY